MSKYRLQNNPHGYPTEEAMRLVRQIKWKSIEKDNMEFSATITCYQKEALRAILDFVEEIY